MNILPNYRRCSNATWYPQFPVPLVIVVHQFFIIIISDYNLKNSSAYAWQVQFNINEIDALGFSASLRIDSNFLTFKSFLMIINNDLWNES